MAIGRGGANIRLASKLNDYEIDVFREDVAQEEDVELLEFRDEIEPWVIDQLRNGGYDTAKSVLRADVEDIARRADLELETVQEVRDILKKEFETE